MNDPHEAAEIADPDEIRQLPGYLWVVARTKARCEKKLAAWCESRGIRHYLPLRRSVYRNERNVRHYMVPIFTGYLFAQVSESQKDMLVTAAAAATLITPSVEMEAQLVRELNDLRLLAEATDSGDLEVREELQVGKTVVIRTGALRGLTGIIQRRRGQARVTVNVEMIGQSVSLDIDVAELDLDC